MENLKMKVIIGGLLRKNQSANQWFLLCFNATKPYKRQNPAFTGLTTSIAFSTFAVNSKVWW